MITMHSALPLKSNINRLYMTKFCWRVMAGKFGCFKDEQRSLAHYLGNSEEELLQYTAAQMGIDVGVLNFLHQYRF